MRVLLSTIGSRGDVQPLVALALQLKALEQDVHLCVPPDFKQWIEGLGFSVTPIGPELRWTGKANPMGTVPSPERLRQMMEGTVATQFETVAAAARGCDLIVAATALQLAARSVAEKMGIPYVFAAFCPAVLPSRHHAPPVLPMRGDTVSPGMDDYSELWAKDVSRWNDPWGPILNAHRATLGLAPVSEVRDHIFGDHPLLAADPVLAPWPEPSDEAVVQTGAWILHDRTALAPDVEAFLDAGDPPVYLGFGSIRAPQDLNSTMIASARRLGHRVIVSRGWADLALVDDAADCLSTGDVNQQALFRRVAAVVHHGGAGTTTAAARAGAPQVVIPQHYDQHYWAHRVDELGIGSAHAASTPTTESLVAVLERALEHDASARARSVAGAMRGDGAAVAARRLVDAG